MGRVKACVLPAASWSDKDDIAFEVSDCVGSHFLKEEGFASGGDGCVGFHAASEIGLCCFGELGKERRDERSLWERRLRGHDGRERGALSAREVGWSRGGR